MHKNITQQMHIKEHRMKYKEWKLFLLSKADFSFSVYNDVLFICSYGLQILIFFTFMLYIPK